MITRIETADGKLAKDLEKGDGIIEYISLSTKGFAATVDVCTHFHFYPFVAWSLFFVLPFMPPNSH
jgi:hypothetical protein